MTTDLTVMSAWKDQRTERRALMLVADISRCL